MSALPEALNTAGDAVPGWYGKVAALGDFAQRRLRSTACSIATRGCPG